MSQEREIKMKEVCQIMHKLGIKKIVVRYSGSGDSGDTDEINYHSDKKVYDSENLPFQIPAVFGSKFKEAKDLNEWLGYNATDFIEGDWYNNDGGQGTITIDTEKEHIHIDAGYNHMETEEVQEEVQL